MNVLNPRKISPLQWVAATLGSLILIALGITSVSVALDGGWQLAFWVSIGLGFALLAIWNLATLGRTSQWPEGAWLVCISSVAIVAGSLGLVSGQWGLGAIVLFVGSMGMGKAVRDRGRR
jgi:hypothetical protein